MSVGKMRKNYSSSESESWSSSSQSRGVVPDRVKKLLDKLKAERQHVETISKSGATMQNRETTRRNLEKDGLKNDYVILDKTRLKTTEPSNPAETGEDMQVSRYMLEELVKVPGSHNSKIIHDTVAKNIASSIRKKPKVQNKKIINNKDKATANYKSSTQKPQAEPQKYEYSSQIDLSENKSFWEEHFPEDMESAVNIVGKYNRARDKTEEWLKKQVDTTQGDNYGSNILDIGDLSSDDDHNEVIVKDSAVQKKVQDSLKGLKAKLSNMVISNETGRVVASQSARKTPARASRVRPNPTSVTMSSSKKVVIPEKSKVPPGKPKDRRPSVPMMEQSHVSPAKRGQPLPSSTLSRFEANGNKGKTSPATSSQCRKPNESAGVRGQTSTPDVLLVVRDGGRRLPTKAQGLRNPAVEKDAQPSLVCGLKAEQKTCQSKVTCHTGLPSVAGGLEMRRHLGTPQPVRNGVPRVPSSRTRTYMRPADTAAPTKMLPKKPISTRFGAPASSPALRQS